MLLHSGIQSEPILLETDLDNEGKPIAYLGSYSPPEGFDLQARAGKWLRRNECATRRLGFFGYQR
jgi:hypothetical protein